MAETTNFQEHLDKIDLNAELTAQEIEAIDAITTNVDEVHLKEALASTCLTVDGQSWSKSMSTLIEEFSTYVEGEAWWWMLKVKDGSTDTPAWITKMLSNIKNNDLAYFIQKVSNLLDYKVQKWYGGLQENLTVSLDKTLGKQTKRALDWLKNWIHEDVKTQDDNMEYVREKFVDKKFLDELVKDATTIDAKNTILKKYNLQWDETNNNFVALDGYKRIDMYGSNYAVESSSDVIPVVEDSDAPVDQSKIVRDANNKLLVDAYGNAVNYVSSISDIPVANFNTPAWWNQVYVINGYTIYGNGRVQELKTKKMFNWVDVKGDIANSLAKETKKSEVTYTSLSQFIDNPFQKLPLYKSDVLVDYHGTKKSIWFVVMQMFNMGWRTESSVLWLYEKYKKDIVWDPVLNSYILYKSMKWAGTYEDVVAAVFNDSNGNLDAIYNAFWKVNNESLLDYLIGDFWWARAETPSIAALQNYVIQLGDESDVARKDILSHNEFMNRENPFEIAKNWYLYALNSKINERKKIDNQQFAGK